MPQSYLFVRSADRTLGTSSAFRVQLPVAYRTVTSISLVSAELPYSMYNVVAPYLRGVMFTHNGLTYVPILPVGFYTIDDLTGSCNMDSPVLVVKNIRLGTAAVKIAGGDCHEWKRGKRSLGLVVNFPNGGQAAKRTAFSEAFANELEARGWSASVFYMVD